MSSEGQHDANMPAPYLTLSLPEGGINECFEEIRSSLCAEGKQGEYRDPLLILSRTIHTSARETYAKWEATCTEK